MVKGRRVRRRRMQRRTGKNSEGQVLDEKLGQAQRLSLFVFLRRPPTLRSALAMHTGSGKDCSALISPSDAFPFSLTPVPGQKPSSIESKPRSGGLPRRQGTSPHATRHAKPWSVIRPVWRHLLARPAPVSRPLGDWKAHTSACECV
jgi:hypothetical protein